MNGALLGEVAGVLWDLDETLLDTSDLRDAREVDWGEVSRNLNKVRPYESHPETVNSRLRSLGLSTGIVTSSPRWYAEALVKQFNLDVDVIITGSDGYVAKPDPGGLLAAAETLGMHPSKLVYVGDDADDHHAAARAGMVSVGAVWAIEGGRAEQWHRHWPDLAFRDPERLIDQTDWIRTGLAAEVSLAGQDPRIHWGSVIPYGGGMSLGRYFDTKDRRSAHHRLSHAIIENKDAHEDSDSFCRAARGVMSRLGSRLGGALVTSVPPHSGSDFDRFGPLRSAIANELNGTDCPQLLVEAHEAEGYKLQGPDERDESNKGRFVAVDVPLGAKIVIVDDVFTFGGTLRTCQTALLEGGASLAYGFSMAHTQESLLEDCPLCGSTLRVIRGRRGRFVGCTGYWSTGCSYTRDV